MRGAVTLGPHALTHPQTLPPHSGPCTLNPEPCPDYSGFSRRTLMLFIFVGFTELSPRTSTLDIFSTTASGVHLPKIAYPPSRCGDRPSMTKNWGACGVDVVTTSGHRKDTAFVDRAQDDLVLDHVAWATRAITVRIPTLDHETFDHAVKNRAVIKRRFNPLGAFFPRPRSARETNEVRHPLIGALSSYNSPPTLRDRCRS